MYAAYYSYTHYTGQSHGKNNYTAHLSTKDWTRLTSINLDPLSHEVSISDVNLHSAFWCSAGLFTALKFCTINCSAAQYNVVSFKAKKV